MPQIRITIDPAGQATVETVGYQGTACQAASRFVEAALGQRQREILTTSYHLTDLEHPAATVFAAATPPGD
jgi:Protein of unknown function (DUF2997)